MKLRWRSHTELPAGGPVFAALIALPDAEGPFLAAGIYQIINGKIINEDTDKARHDAEFWWIPESELLAQLDERKS